MFRGLMSVTSDCIWMEKTRLLGGMYLKLYLGKFSATNAMIPVA
jgi:hypothetical protein